MRKSIVVSFLKMRKSIVVALLAKEFNIDNAEMASREENKMANSIKILLNQCEDNFEVVEEKELEQEFDMEENEDLYVEDKEIEIPENMVRFEDNWVPVEQVEEAIFHYRNTNKGFRSLSSMLNKFRFIETENHLKKRF